jgi:hypothetical protein
MASYLITTYCMIGIEWSEKHEKWSYKNYNFYMVIFFQLCSFGIENMIVSGHLISLTLNGFGEQC